MKAYFLNKGIQKAESYTKATGNPGIVRTDNKPVFQEKQNLDKGKFSKSKRLQDLLVNLSAKRFSIQLMSAKLPSSILAMVDFSSRNPVQCDVPSCTICKDVSTISVGATNTETPNVLNLSVDGWKQIQQSCPDLRRAHSLLSTGAKLSKKEKNAKDIRSYLSSCTINRQGLVVRLKNVPLQAKPAETIVIPRAFAFTLAKSLHVNLNHPLPSQMLKQFQKRYFALDEKILLQQVYETCDYPCQASRILPKETMKFSTTTKPSKIGEMYNADVLEEANQKILVIRENLTSYTDSMLLKDQTKPTLKSALITLLSRLKVGPTCSVRVDNQSSLASLCKDRSLEPHGILLITGEPKNVNKNAVVDKAIRELREQLIRINPTGRKISQETLALATSFLNNLVRHPGLSAKELWMSRNTNSGENLTLDDVKLSNDQFRVRKATHKSSAKYQSRNAPEVIQHDISHGQSVYVKSDRSKSKSRDSFVVLSVDKDAKMAIVQKFPMQRFRSHPIQVNLDNLYSAQASIPPRHECSVQDVTNSLAPRHAPNWSQMMKSANKPAPDSSSSESSDDTVQSSSDSESNEDSYIFSEPEGESKAPSTDAEREDFPVESNQDTEPDSVNNEVLMEQTTDTQDKP